MAERAGRLEEIFSVFALMYFGGSFGFGNELAGAPVLPPALLTLMRYFIFAGMLLLLALRPERTLKTAMANKWALALVGIIALSFLWSPFPTAVGSTVVKELIPMLCCSLFIASRFTIRQQFRIVCWTLVLMFLVSIFLVFAMPSVGIHTVDAFAGSWKGVFSQKNEFGAHSTMTLIALFLLSNYAQKTQRWMFPFFGFCFAAVLISQSATALVLSVIGLLLTIFYKRFTWQGTKSVLWASLIILILSGVLSIVIISWVPMMDFLGKDATLTGRTLIWGYLINFAIPENLDSFLIGHGRGIFWISPDLFIGVQYAAHHIPSHAHNGFLDLILDVGMVGFSLFLITWGIAYVKAIKLAYNFKYAAHLWPVIFLSMLVLFNIFESYLARITNLYWLVFIMMAFSLNRKNLSLD